MGMGFGWWFWFWIIAADVVGDFGGAMFADDGGGELDGEGAVGFV